MTNVIWMVSYHLKIFSALPFLPLLFWPVPLKFGYRHFPSTPPPFPKRGLSNCCRTLYITAEVPAFSCETVSRL